MSARVTLCSMPNMPALKLKLKIKNISSYKETDVLAIVQYVSVLITIRSMLTHGKTT